MNFKKERDFSKGSSNRKLIQQEFLKERWKPFRDWFFKSFDKKETSYFQEEFYKFVTKKDQLVLFVPWVLATYVDPYITTLERVYLNEDGNTTRGIFPPQNPFSIKKDDDLLKFSAFYKLFDNTILQTTTSHINLLIKQGNYANL